MKKNGFSFSLAVLFSFFSLVTFAQRGLNEPKHQHCPKWVSVTGYWVAESNRYQPAHNIIYFYNNDDTLVYKETTDGVVLQLNRRKIKMHLKRLVDQTVAAYAQSQIAKENQQLVLNRTKK